MSNKDAVKLFVKMILFIFIIPILLLTFASRSSLFKNAADEWCAKQIVKNAEANKKMRQRECRKYFEEINAIPVRIVK